MNFYEEYVIHFLHIVAGVINDASETADIANSVNDCDGVYFVPAFSGLQVSMINTIYCEIEKFSF